MEYSVFCEKLKEWNDAPNHYKKYVVVGSDGKKKVEQLFFSEMYSVPCRYRKRSPRYGNPLCWEEIEEIQDFYPQCKVVDNAKKLQRVCKRAAELMEVSGLWPDHLRCFKAIRDASYEEVQEFLGDLSYDYQHYDAWMQRHGVERCFISCDELYGLLSKGVVSIPYDKYVRDLIRSEARDAIREDRSYSHHWRGSYDYSISIEKQADGKKRAWYSAEFKGCGNGHYYLMIDEGHAFHCEDD